MKTERFGVCRLTGTRGKFAKSHLIPRAFTKPTENGAPLLQAGHRTPISERYDSWYDRQIVTQEGEYILGQIDDAAIRELRKHKLVWSGWGGMRELNDPDHHLFMPPAHGVRRVRGINTGVLRTFFLSLLWRAAVTSRFEFAEVMLSEADVRQLGELVLSGEWGPADFYPATLIQLSTVGLIHNFTPIVETKHMPGAEGSPAWTVDIVRFYLDGLMVHLHIPGTDDGQTSRLGPVMLGGDDWLAVTTVTYEQSWQAENLEDVITHSMFPDDPPGRKRR
ncbi:MULTISPECIES: hypothetical protein [unclassified Methylobacterium]|uniref:hypothetical protein n=1 Tax=unclassified Methylobacterium TaxID=2615210 RepID=UPI00226AA10B|nr:MULTISPECIES: hypothetical protein [unclassified Methylobacterium]